MIFLTFAVGGVFVVVIIFCFKVAYKEKYFYWKKCCFTIYGMPMPA
jgi:hypothetical protein